MRDVAAEAGVSVKTVSRVVNNERWVSSEVAARVEGAIAKLGYRPDARARAMRNSGLAGRTLGVVHADLANPFFTAVHSGIESVAHEAGCTILTASSHDSHDKQDGLIRTFNDRRVDGFIVVPAADTVVGSSPALDEEVDRLTPIVCIDRRYGAQTDFVRSDNVSGAKEATEHLLAHGHLRIAFLGDNSGLWSAQRRLAGYRDALESSNVDIDEALIISGLDDSAAAAAAVNQLLDTKTPPTAFFAAKNHLAIGAVQALHARKLQNEIALVGFDEISLADLISPGITTIPQNAPALGRIACELLLDRLDNGRSTAIQQTVPVSLVARGSGEILGPLHSQT